MATIKLKVRCISCGGTGAYCTQLDAVCVPCWTCLGRGWRHSSMDAPDPKWARQYQSNVRARAKANDRLSAQPIAAD